MREYIPLTEPEKINIREKIGARFGNLFDEALVSQFIHIFESSTIVELGYDDLFECLSFCKGGYEVFTNLAELEQCFEQNGSKFKMVLAYRVYNIEQSSFFPECFDEYSEVLKKYVKNEGFLATCCSVNEFESGDFYLVSK